MDIIRPFVDAMEVVVLCCVLAAIGVTVTCVVNDATWLFVVCCARSETGVSEM